LSTWWNQERIRNWMVSARPVDRFVAKSCGHCLIHSIMHVRIQFCLLSASRLIREVASALAFMHGIGLVSVAHP